MLQRGVTTIGVAITVWTTWPAPLGLTDSLERSKISISVIRKDYPSTEATIPPTQFDEPLSKRLSRIRFDHFFLDANIHEAALPLAGWADCNRTLMQPYPDKGVDPAVGSLSLAVFSDANLEQAIAAVVRSHGRTLYLHTGLYRLERTLALDAADDGLQLTACPGETPIIQGAAASPAITLTGNHGVSISHLVFAGTASVSMLLDGATGSHIERNLFLHGAGGILLDHAAGNLVGHNIVLGMDATGIELKDGSDANTIADNVIDGAGAPETFGGGIFLHGVSNNRVAHNLVQNTAGFGIGILNWNDATLNSGNIVEYNLLRGTAKTSTDSGAIYILGRSGGDTGTVIVGNVIDGVGASDRHTVGIYLDDSSSGVTVIRNLVRGIGSDGVEIHGGSNNLIENNLIDLGAGRPSAVLFQAAPADTNPSNLQTGNAVLQNIVVSANASPRFFVWYDGGTPLVTGNFYATLTGMGPALDGPVIDHAPVLADLATMQPRSTDDYGAVQRAASLIGFRAIDIRAAGVRPDGTAASQ